MKKNYFPLMYITLLLFTVSANAQTLNQPANWPNTSWVITGDYLEGSTIFEANPRLVGNFAYNDSNAANYHSNFAAESPVIDLTAAYNAGETRLTISTNYVFHDEPSINEKLAFEYYDFDTSTWKAWGPPLQGNDTNLYNDFCSGTSQAYTTEMLNIASFTVSQLSNFRYRIRFNDNNGWGYGFCMQPPTITSALPPPVIVTKSAPINEAYCYGNNENKGWLFKAENAENGENLRISFSSGSVESSPFGGTIDDLIIYDGMNSAGTVLFNSDTDGDQFEGLSFLASSGYIYMKLTSNGGGSCISNTVDVINFNVNAVTISLSPSTLPNATSGTAYSQAITASGGTGPYSFEVISGSLPAGLTLSNDGVLSGTPTATGTYNFRIKATDASSEYSHQAYTLIVGGIPEINIQGNSATIADGDNTPSTTDHTDFSSAAVASGSIVRTFTIQNTGTASLSISSVGISGANAADFSVTTAAATTVAAEGNTTFSVTFNPSATGTRNATITVNSNDADEAVYDFAVTGVGTDLIVSTTQSNVSCNGGANGSATVSPSGATGTVTYSWSPSGGNAATASNLAAGTYTVTVTDDNETETVDVTITQPANALSATATATNVSCKGGNDGEVNLTVSGGTAPYTFAWDNGANTKDISDLTAGTYNVTVTDANGCTTTASIEVTEPANALSATATATNVSCNGGNDGAVNLTVSGGTAPYTFAWDNGANTKDISDLTAGTYNVTVTDDNGCTTTASIEVTEPANALSATATATNVSCNGGNDGAVNLTVSGGTSPYVFAWDNGANTKDISGLSAGTYNVTVTDANGCTTTASIEVTEPANALSATATATNVSCNGGNDGAVNLTVSGGTSPYVFAWDNGANTKDITGLTAGTYNVTVTDDNGCTTTASVAVTEPANALAATATATNVSCKSGSNGAVNLTVSGGTSPYTFAWDNGANTKDITGLTAGTYNVTVTDNNGCTTTASIEVTEPANALAATATATNVSCKGGNDGEVNLTVSGGTAPYTFAWDNGANTKDISDLTAGTYNVTVTDANGCTTTASIEVTEPANALSASATATNVSCKGGNDGEVNLTVSGGTAPYTFAWDNGANTKDISGLSAGTYNVTITDANGCTTTASIEVTEPANALAATATATNVSCKGGNDGEVNLTVSGGTAPYTFAWDNGANTKDISDLTAGTYNVTVTDANGCTTTASIEVTEPANALSASATATNVSCKGGNDGEVNLTVSGGTAPYTFAWDNGANTKDISGLSAGTYNVTITDANGCTTTASATVTVEDNTLPTASCQSITVQLGANGNVDITASDVNNGSSDNCGIATMTISQSSFDCTMVGDNQVTLTVTDTNGNASTCTTTVTVNDAAAPTAVGLDELEVDLAGNPQVVINPTDVDNGSSDNCNFSLSLSEDTFTAVGTYIIQLIATDDAGNTDEVNVTIKVIDSTLGVTDVIEPVNLTIYPQPANGLLYFKAPEPVQKVTIFNLNGKKIGEHQLDPGPEQRLDITNLSSAVYFLKVELSGGSVVFKKVIVE